VAAVGVVATVRMLVAAHTISARGGHPDWLTVSGPDEPACVFNDDVQGTGAVVMAALYSHHVVVRSLAGDDGGICAAIALSCNGIRLAGVLLLQKAGPSRPVVDVVFPSSLSGSGRSLRTL
jgi:hypothetical protein